MATPAVSAQTEKNPDSRVPGLIPESRLHELLSSSGFPSDVEATHIRSITGTRGNQKARHSIFFKTEMKAKKISSSANFKFQASNPHSKLQVLQDSRFKISHVTVLSSFLCRCIVRAKQRKSGPPSRFTPAFFPSPTPPERPRCYGHSYEIGSPSIRRLWAVYSTELYSSTALRLYGSMMIYHRGGLCYGLYGSTGLYVVLCGEFDAEISRLQQALHNVPTERGALQEYYNSCRCVALPLSQLPSETLIEIFRLRLYTDSPIDSSLFSLYIHQNYTQFCNGTEECEGVADWLSWAAWYQANPHRFHLLTLGTLHSLPTPVTRRSQKIFKTEFFDFLNREKEAWEASRAEVATELGGVLKARDAKWLYGSQPSPSPSQSHSPSHCAPPSHRRFSHLQFFPGGGSGNELGEAEAASEGVEVPEDDGGPRGG
ncbi:hypothetical protein C8J57DRAFT_1477252 [Mycena rebaudengoi]|nr:hypothetical protein C8J57DRAFT_1477252 [Mycena rebaudengoi]